MNGAGGFGERLRARFAEATVVVAEPRGEMLVEVPATAWRETCAALRDEFGFEQAMDLSGVDYLGYGSDEWDTSVSSEGFSRGVEGKGAGRFVWGESPNGAADAPERRFAAVAHMLSVQNNLRVRQGEGRPQASGRQPDTSWQQGAGGPQDAGRQQSQGRRAEERQKDPRSDHPGAERPKSQGG